MSDGPHVEGEPMTVEELAVYAVTTAAKAMLEECMEILEEREPGLGQWLLETMADREDKPPRLTVVRDNDRSTPPDPKV